MRAIVCERLGGPQHLRLSDLPSLAIGSGQVRIEIRAAGLNFPDLLMLDGKYQHKPEPPYVPGMECAGIIIESRSPDFAVGDRVIAGMKTGAFAEETVVDAASILSLPTTMSFEEGATFRIGFLTAYTALVRFGHLQAAETLLINGASGGVGMAAVMLGKHLGSRIIATGGTEEKLAAVRAAGADDVIDLSRQDLRDTALDLTEGRGVDVVYDPVGGEVFHQSLRCLRFGGRALIIGFTSGTIPEVAMGRFLIKGLSVIGIRAGEFGRQFPREAAQDRVELMKLAGNGVLKPHISLTLPLAEARTAMEMMRDRKIVGRAVLTNSSV